MGPAAAEVASGALPLPPPLPGADDVELRSAPSTAVHTGTATVDLDDRPVGTTSVELRLMCLSAGTFTFADGAELSCSPADADGTGTAMYSLPLGQDQTRTTITSTPGTRWSVTSTYSTRRPTDWGVNANGETYGVVKDDGSTPDLVAVATTTSTGEQGYVYATDLGWNMVPPTHAAPQGPVPVYAWDGTTVLGQFQVG